MKRGKPFDEQISEEMYERAWILKCKGFPDRVIAEKIGCKHGTYDHHKWKFEVFFAKKRREMRSKEMRQATRTGKVGRSHGSDRLDKVRNAAIELAKLGEPQRKISEQLGIPHSTFRSWLETDEVFNHQITTAKDKADEQVISSLLARATGRSTVRNVHETTQLDGRGNVIARTRQATTSRLSPNLGAIKLWLVNRRSWISEGEGTRIDEDSKRVEYDVREGLYSEKVTDSNLA